MHLTQRPGLLFIVSGPTASGKTTLCRQMLQHYPIRRIVTCTTRPLQSGENQGIDYDYVSVETFQNRITAGDFYEYACVYGHYYGTLKKAVQAHLERDRDTLLAIDVQGAAAFRKAAQKDPFLKKRSVSVFILPPDLETLRRRLEQRGRDTEEAMKRRLCIALEEIKQYAYYDYCIVTSSREADFEALQSIYKAEKFKVRIFENAPPSRNG